MKIAKGMKEDGIIIGNSFDKYCSRNPIVRRIMAGFESAFLDMVTSAAPHSIHEVGCGEGYWIQKWASQGIPVHGSDFSGKVISLARENGKLHGLAEDSFSVRSIYDLEAGRDSADLIVCTEVLEHLAEPEKGLEALQRIAVNQVLLSVPREPIWRMLNMARGKYLPHFGNTPGHLNHWSSASFTRFVERYFDIIEIRKPLPWTILMCRAKKQNNRERSRTALSARASSRFCMNTNVLTQLAIGGQ